MTKEYWPAYRHIRTSEWFNTYVTTSTQDKEGHTLRQARVFLKKEITADTDVRDHNKVIVAVVLANISKFVPGQTITLEPYEYTILMESLL